MLQYTKRQNRHVYHWIDSAHSRQVVTGDSAWSRWHTRQKPAPETRDMPLSESNAVFYLPI